jgi:hypothetical protein
MLFSSDETWTELLQDPFINPSEIHSVLCKKFNLSKRIDVPCLDMRHNLLKVPVWIPKATENRIFIPLKM